MVKFCFVSAENVQNSFVRKQPYLKIIIHELFWLFRSNECTFHNINSTHTGPNAALWLMVQYGIVHKKILADPEADTFLFHFSRLTTHFFRTKV